MIRLFTALVILILLTPVNVSATKENPYGVIGNAPEDVWVHYYGDERFADFYRNALLDLNEMIEYMPNAPNFRWDNEEPNQTCNQIRDDDGGPRPIRRGITICTFDETDGDWWWNPYAPAGCPKCAGAPYWRNYDAYADWTGIHVEGTDASDITPALAFSCQHAPGSFVQCHGSYELGQTVAYHEMAHAAFGIGHIADSATSGWGMFGPADFAAAEEDFGQSTVEYCAIFPAEDGC